MAGQTEWIQPVIYIVILISNCDITGRQAWA